jgi:hypothetical protein
MSFHLTGIYFLEQSDKYGKLIFHPNMGFLVVSACFLLLCCDLTRLSDYLSEFVFVICWRIDLIESPYHHYNSLILF